MKPSVATSHEHQTDTSGFPSPWSEFSKKEFIMLNFLSFFLLPQIAAKMPHIWLTSLWRTYTIFIFLILITAAVAAPCQNDQYWNPMKDTCIQCKLCGDQEFVVRPCQPHMDTICGDIKDFKFNWNWLERSDVRADEVDYKEVSSTFLIITLCVVASTFILLQERRRDREEQEEAELQDEHASEIVTQWQIVSLIIAVTACLFFFITVAFISLNHTRQWRRIEKHFDAGNYLAFIFNLSLHIWGFNLLVMSVLCMAYSNIPSWHNMTRDDLCCDWEENGIQFRV